MQTKFKEVKVPWNKIDVLGDLKGPEEAPGRPVHEEDGEENSSLVEVTFDGKSVKIPKEFIVEPKTRYLEEDLAIYAPAWKIIEVHRDAPHLLRARKVECSGKCDECDDAPGGDESSCKKKKT